MICYRECQQSIVGTVKFPEAHCLDPVHRYKYSHTFLCSKSAPHISISNVSSSNHMCWISPNNSSFLTTFCYTEVFCFNKTGSGIYTQALSLSNLQVLKSCGTEWQSFLASLANWFLGGAAKHTWQCTLSREYKTQWNNIVASYRSHYGIHMEPRTAYLHCHELQC